MLHWFLQGSEDTECLDSHTFVKVMLYFKKAFTEVLLQKFPDIGTYSI